MNPLSTTVKERSKISRRAFLATSAVAAGGTLVIGFRLHGPFHIAKKAEANEDPFDAWIHIYPDNRTELVLAQSEMGQGVYTSLPMLLAEEAELDWERVSVVQSDQSRGTGGSGSVIVNFVPLRQAGAVVREVMIATAAHRWNVAREECVARKSEVLHTSSGRRLRYGELVKDARRMPLPDAKSVKLKDPKNFTLIGKEIPHLDILAKVAGTAQFGLDIRLPGMVYAVIARCPTFGGVPASFDTSKALATPGVLQVFEIPPRGFRIYSAGGIVVVAKTTWAAMQGRKALEITWNHGPNSAESSEALTAKIRAALDEPSIWSTSTGASDPDKVSAARRIESIYEFPFLAHSTMEPMNITIHLRGRKCEIWCPSQSADWSRGAAAKELGLPESNVTVHTTFMGGGFGRRYIADFQTEAAQIVKHVSSPVQLVWTREDDMTHDFYRPAGMHRLRGALDENGNLVAWSHRVADTSLRVQWDQPDKIHPESAEVGNVTKIVYPVQSMHVSYVPVESAVPRGWWRSVGNSFSGFAVECFIDELAHAGKEDPYLFRRRLLQAAIRNSSGKEQSDNQRLLAMLDLVAEKAGWGKPMKKNQGRGIACWAGYAFIAQVAEVTVDGSGIQVDRMVTAIDAGQLVNPNGARSQIEGGTLFSLSAFMKEAITIRDGAVEQQNFNQYDLLRMPETPVLETYFLDSHDEPHGLGEAGVALPGPSVANAVFAACGKRLRKLPFRVNEITA
ncbi:MAG TPA: molybdopterin cofactor-binding domain-containing protein [Pseudacidobacterium sp.]|nr:molybdopterin cofactor-binding domain-containing protein [Pseudacidobacterium sp.]